MYSNYGEILPIVLLFPIFLIMTETYCDYGNYFGNFYGDDQYDLYGSFLNKDSITQNDKRRKELKYFYETTKNNHVKHKIIGSKSFNGYFLNIK